MTLGMLIGHWELAPQVLVGCTALAAIYGMAARQSRAWPPVRTVAFVSGLAVIVVALDAGVDANDGRLLSVHMVQHLLLIDVAPVLLILGRPTELLLRTSRGAPRRRLGRGIVWLARRANPAVCIFIYTAIVLGTHVPVIFTATLRHSGLHALEHIAYVIAGGVMWWPLLGKPNLHRLEVFGRILYVTVAMVPMTLLGAYIDRAGTLLYPLYAGPARALGVSALADQQQAGAIMWIASTTFMGLVALWSAMDAMLTAEARQRARELHEVAS